MKNKTSQIIMLILVLTVGNYLFFSIKSNIKNYDFFYGFAVGALSGILLIRLLKIWMYK